MKKHELLVPAGDIDCLRQAVFNGCDAVYIACKSFGARKFAINFTNDEVIDAIHLCHLYGVKLFVTMNTLIKNNEVDLFLEQAEFLHKNGVDALIVQDFGMICLLREMFPNLEIHASTQANISSRDVCELYYKLGVKRVVFSRELSIDDIDSIDIPIEKEAFIHGALCISYSGQCLMSSMLGGRSGNRGECAGTCRMKYSLYKKNKCISSSKYLLSTKELNSVYNIDRLINSSIYSFKIEGRMKNPFYVGFITRLYRRLLDKEVLDISSELDKLKTIFNRDFTKGRLFNEIDSNFMNINSPNHIGLEIGKVISVNKDKIKIKLNDNYELNQNDAIRFLESNKGFHINYLYDKKMNLVSSVSDICYVDNKVGINSRDRVSKTHDYLLENEYNTLPKRKIDISFKVSAFVGKKLTIEISDGTFTFIKNGNLVEKSINSPISKDLIIKHLSKLGDSAFTCSNYDISCDDDIFIPVKELNNIRRDLVLELTTARSNRCVNYVKKDVSFDYDCDIEDISINCLVYSEKDLLMCLELGVNKIYVMDKDLYNKYSNCENVYYYVRRCVFDIKKELGINNLVSDYSIYNDYNVVGNYSLNVTNIYTAYYLKKIGLKSICLSVELNENELLEFIKLYNNKFGYMNFEILVCGRVTNMFIKGNILGLDINSLDCYLVDSKKRKFPVFYDGINTHIFNWECRNLDISRFRGICSLRFDFLFGDRECKELLLDEINVQKEK